MFGKIGEVMSLLTSQDGVKNKVREIAPGLLKSIHEKIIETDQIPKEKYSTVEIAFTPEGNGVMVYARIYEGTGSTTGPVHDINEFIDMMPSSFSDFLK